MTQYLRHLLVLILLCGSVARLAAQAPPPPVTNLVVTVQPKDGSILITETTNVIFVTITNYTAFTNLTVVGSFGAVTNVINFRDDGVQPDAAATNGTFSGNLITPKVTVGTTQTLTLVIRGDLVDPVTVDIPADPRDPNSVDTQVILTNAVRTNLVHYFIVPRPGNDKFTNAFKIAKAGDTVTGTNNYASLERGEPVHAQVPTVDSSVWWDWSPSVSGSVLVDLAGSSFNPVLAVYTGSNVTNLVQVAASTNDVVNKLKANVVFNATAGTTYRIAVSGYDKSTNSVGDIRLRVAPGAKPDTAGPLVSITTPASESLFTTDVISFAGTAKERGLNESGVSRVILQVNSDTNIIVASGTSNWTASMSLPPGTNLVRAVAIDFAGNKGPAAAVVVRYLNPINDLFANAVSLSNLASGLETAQTAQATREPGEPLHAGNEGGHSIWYRWQAPFTGNLTLTTQSSSFDTLLGVYVGSSLTNLVEIASNDDEFDGSGYSSLTQKVVANQVYYIAVDGFGGESGSAALSYSFVTTDTLYGLFLSGVLGGTVLPPSDLYAENANVVLTAIPDKNYEFVEWDDFDAGFTSTENPLSIFMTRNYFLTAKFRVKNYSDTFKTGNLKQLAWSTAGASPWAVQTFEGQTGARSGPVSDRQSSSLILQTNLYAGAGAFDLRVSSEEGWDWLEFYVNGSRLGRWSGEVPWQTFNFPVTAGANTLEWRYVKDANFSQGLDAAFVDNVYVPLERPDPPRTNAVLSLQRLTSGAAQISLIGQPNISYVLQTSANLKDWSTLSTNSSSGIAVQFIDPEAARNPRRFYRAFSR